MAGRTWYKKTWNFRTSLIKPGDKVIVDCNGKHTEMIWPSKIELQEWWDNMDVPELEITEW